MSLFALLKEIKHQHFDPQAPKPVRTQVPMKLSQDSAVSISLAPLILAEDAGALFKSDLPTDQKIIAVGRLGLFGVDYYRAYLSDPERSFIHFATRRGEILETRIYRPYGEELNPATKDEWEFWVADADGYIGAPVMQSRDVDGSIPYRRTWGSGNGPLQQRISPYLPVETIVDLRGQTTTVRHRLMHYGRALKDPKLSEYLLVSVVETDSGAAIDFWLGIDLAAADLTVFPAADAP